MAKCNMCRKEIKSFSLLQEVASVEEAKALKEKCAHEWGCPVEARVFNYGRKKLLVKVVAKHYNPVRCYYTFTHGLLCPACYSRLEEGEKDRNDIALSIF